MNIKLFIAFAAVAMVNSYPATNSSCDCVCGSRVEKTFRHNNTQPDESPWIVGVFHGGEEGVRIFICSGSLITNEHVLVSGECVERVILVRTRIGSETQIRMSNDVNFHSNDTVRRDIIRTHVHRNYKNTLYPIIDHNIGILQMDKAVSFDDSIQPICLPQSPYVDYSGKLATVTGLYDTSTSETSFLRSKTQITGIPIWTTEQCAELPDYKDQFTYNMLCAGDHPESGIFRPFKRDFDFGQLVIDGEHGGMEIIGIYSSGSKSGLGSNKPVLYTRVADFVPWIQSILTNHCMCPPKNSIKDDSSIKFPAAEKPTDLCSQPANNSSCNCVCGHRENQKQVVDGVYAQPSQFPWVVGAYTFGHLGTPAYCSSDTILFWPQIEVRLGINAPSGIKRGVSRIYIHENYDESRVDFNIAIWQLDEKVVFGFTIQPICLPSSSSETYAGKLATAAGWYNDNIERSYLKATSMTSIVSRSKLHQIHVPMWTNEKCAELSNDPERVTDNVICAGEYEDGVRRDCMDFYEVEQIAIENENGNMELVGIYSFGPKCGTLGIPTVYTRVAKFLPWIQNKTKHTMDVCS